MATNLKLIPRAERLLEGKITADMTDSQTTVTVDNPPLITALPSYLEIDPDSATYRELCRVIAVSSSTITLERGLNNGGTGFPHSNNTAYKFKFTSRHWEAVATALESGYLTEDSSYVFTQVSTSSFKITASSVDRTDKYTQGRRVRLNGSVVTRIISSSYSNPDTTVVVEGTSVPAVITTVEIELTTEGNTNIFIPYDYIDTDDTLSDNSDTKIPSQKAVKTYVDTNITVTADSATTFTNKDLTSTTNTFPIYCQNKVVSIQVVAGGDSVAIADGQAYITIPLECNGMNLVGVHARVITAGTTNTTDIQIRNVTDSVDMLSTKLTIDSGETGSDTAATPAVIDTTKDDVATNDLLAIDIDAKSTTAPKGLIITLRFALP